MTEPTQRRPGRFRPDIEGLRAVAVVAVVVYHAGVGWLPGGFVGVDVFYVISGFLITGLLWRELAAGGRLSLAGFYGRRARRLLPAAMVVLAVTMVASLELLPPLQVRSVWKDGLFSAIYAGNYRFAATRTDYLAASAPSPFTHFWSLGVEEQFYLVWPLLLLVGCLGWRRGRPSRPAALLTLTVASAASLGLSLYLTRTDQPLAFFSLPTRAWELGLGGMLALLAPGLRRLPRTSAAVLGWAGLAAVCVACVGFGAETPFPGTAALLPVLGAGAVIASGLRPTPSGPVLLLGRRVPRFLGRISYSWYLWHYPVLILAPYALGHALAEWQALLLCAASAVLAWGTYRLVEDPARRAVWLAARPARSLGAGLSMSAAGVAVCLVASGLIPSVQGHGRAPLAAIRQPAAPRAASAFQRTRAVFRAEQAEVEAAVARSVHRSAVPANLQPPLTDAASSEAPVMVNGCLLTFTASTQPTCRYGDPTGTRSIVLFGDSHAAMWFPAVDAYAVAHHAQLYVWTKATCPPVDVDIFSLELDQPFTQCTQWRSAVEASIASLHPELVVMDNSPLYSPAYRIAEWGPAWRAGTTSVIRAMHADGARVMFIGPDPSPPDDVPDCVSANLGDLDACDFPPVDYPGLASEAATVRAAGGHWVDVTPWFCTRSRCPAVIDDVLVYRDSTHITVPFADYVAPLISDQITETLQRSPS